MAWFKKNLPVQPTVLTPEERKTNIEIVAHKKATQKQIAETKKISQNLNQLLEANGFTLKIYLAAGGKTPRTRITK